ncbi:MAG: hypothetical protein F6J89_02445 [Symploca sp. SIO1C4]|uniref:Polysaccharide chain length determinant N-terminal domain-containing protein n=1 Tax=Symploca sp. SIO1C4 TaxID=2607765 RepID=A0A6B3NA54_9CYAN|nr:hypothetical protein [Symploca sp. SIO1C4]
MVKQIRASEVPEEDEISIFADSIWFVSYNLRFIGLTTLVLSALAITLSLLQPQRYQKQLNLSAKPVELPVTGIPGININQASNLTVELLKHHYEEIDEIDARAKYNTQTQQIELTLNSPDTTYLDKAGSNVTTLLAAQLQATVAETAANSLQNIDLAINKNKKILAQLEQEIVKVRPAISGNTQSPQTTLSQEALAFRLEALESKRTNQITTITALEFDKQYLKPAQNNLANFTSKVISIKIVTEYEMKPTRSLLQIIVLAIIASFMVAVLAAIIREQIPHLKKELSHKKPHTSPDA